MMSARPSFLDPALRGRAALELGDDAGLALEQGLAQRGLLRAKLLQLLDACGQRFLVEYLA